MYLIRGSYFYPSAGGWKTKQKNKTTLLSFTYRAMRTYLGQLLLAEPPVVERTPPPAWPSFQISLRPARYTLRYGWVYWPCSIAVMLWSEAPNWSSVLVVFDLCRGVRAGSPSAVVWMPWFCSTVLCSKILSGFQHLNQLNSTCSVPQAPRRIHSSIRTIRSYGRIGFWTRNNDTYR